MDSDHSALQLGKSGRNSDRVAKPTTTQNRMIEEQIMTILLVSSHNNNYQTAEKINEKPGKVQTRTIFLKFLQSNA